MCRNPVCFGLHSEQNYDIQRGNYVAYSHFNVIWFCHLQFATVTTYHAYVVAQLFGLSLFFLLNHSFHCNLLSFFLAFEICLN